jgi:hypothetical protein
MKIAFRFMTRYLIEFSADYFIGGSQLIIAYNEIKTGVGHDVIRFPANRNSTANNLGKKALIS